MTTTNLTSDEREKRLTKPYKEHLRETLKTSDDYRDYLNACHEEGPETFALAAQDVVEFATTRMRDKCVKAIRDARKEAAARGVRNNYWQGSMDAFDAALRAVKTVEAATTKQPTEVKEGKTDA